MSWPTPTRSSCAPVPPMSERMRLASWGLLALLSACGGARPPGEGAVTCGGGERAATGALCASPAADASAGEAAASRPSDLGDGGAASSTATPEPSAAPRPTTVALARTGVPELDELLRRGDAAFEDDKLDEADRAYREASTKFPKRVAGSVGRARVRMQRAAPSLGFAAAEGDKTVGAVASELRALAAREPAFAVAKLELGRALLLLGDGASARTVLEATARTLADEPEAHSTLGIALLATGDGEGAVAALGKARELDPGSAARRGNYGTALMMRGRVADALVEYEAAARLTPDDARAQSDLGTARLAAGKPEAALAPLERAIALDGKRATFRSNLGYALQLLGRRAEAIAAYRAALALDEKLVSAWVNLATALARDPATRAEARKALERARKLEPDDPRVKANLQELDELERAGRP